jgi:putative ABC transport system ATP-binding protein
VFQLNQLATEQVGPCQLTLNPGEIVAISGASGIGKSLLLQACADLIPHRGEVRLNGVSAVDFGPSVWRRQVSYLGPTSCWWRYCAGDHFPSPLTPQLHSWFLQVGLKPAILEQVAVTLSSGERQRLALLRLLQQGPTILLLDEPTSFLDSAGKILVEQLVQEYLAADQQRAAIWVTHDLEQLERVGDRALWLADQLTTWSGRGVSC